MSSYLYRLASFAYRRRRLVLGLWLLAAIAAIAIAQASGGKTNDTFSIPGTESQNAAAVLTAKLPAFSGGSTTIVFATHNAVSGQGHRRGRQGGDRVRHGWPQVDSAGLRRHHALPEQADFAERHDRARHGAVVGAGDET